MSAKCWVCEEPAQASCRFCGRFVCKDHATLYPFLLTIWVGANETPKALVVADAIWCGVCRIQPQPMEMPELY